MVSRFFLGPALLLLLRATRRAPLRLTPVNRIMVGLLGWTFQQRIFITTISRSDSRFSPGDFVGEVVAKRAAAVTPACAADFPGEVHGN